LSATAEAVPARGIAGHPAGLRTLFFTELWERFSYYGMRAILVLFMVAATENGGLGLDDDTATAIYGLYTAAVYFVALPGGWIADRLLGAQRAIWYGGIIIMFGHFTLAIPSVYAFFTGLLLVVLGTGLLKPNISAVVGGLYGENDGRRDAGFTLFYMAINLGGFLGPIVCGALGESEGYGWHWGFASAGVGMAFGLAYFRYSRGLLGDAGLKPSLNPAIPAEREAMRRAWRRLWIGLGMLVAVVALLFSGVVAVNAVTLAENSMVVILLIGAGYIGYLLAFGGLTTEERGRIIAAFILCMAAALFWAGFEQQGSTFALFAERYTDRFLGAFEIPASWFQSFNPAFVILLAPVFALLWVRMASAGLEPHTPVKFAVALILLGLGFAVMIPASMLVVGGSQAAPTWLITTILLQTMGELMLSPVGLSAMTKLAPQRFVGQMMGIWFLTSGLGNLIAGLAAGLFESDAVGEFPQIYTEFVLIFAGFGVLMLLFLKPIRRLMSGVH
jgi:POT family proton-dependent oligopeptide transporter